jgi:hypothetical protein
VTISNAISVAEVVYLTESRQITGEVLHVDGGAHTANGKPGQRPVFGLASLPLGLPVILELTFEVNN